MDTIKITAFNNLLSEFNDFLKKTFPSEKCLEEYQVKIKMANTVNPLLIYSLFREYVLPYKQEIINCNEKFFLEEFNKLFDKNTLEFVDFTKLWTKKENTLEVKARIFQYFRKMIKLCS